MKYKTVVKLMSDYVKGDQSQKAGIVWHFTAGGTRQGAEAQLALPDTVNVHILIDDDGTRYQYLTEPQWAYHTGTGRAWDRVAFGVEIRNWGPLTKVDGLYLPWTKQKTQAVDPKRVVRVRPFRGYEFFEMLTTQQVESAIELKCDWYKRHFIVWEKTHAEMNPKKTDFPPDFEQINQVIRYRAGVLVEHQQDQPIIKGYEGRVTQSSLQKRINYLLQIMKVSYSHEELSRLIRFRDGK